MLIFVATPTTHMMTTYGLDGSSPSISVREA
uniref:Uncharacterized protein n=1 Tax=Siphoviridae sp. ctL0q1 TaxID=2825449 RepID=A0A8S5PKG0_9CAUD|nr:MAG TPA: hypothetical protein [Siphoviridae sp. ctL0q1]